MTITPGPEWPTVTGVPWATPADANRMWPESVDLDVPVLDDLLQAAYEQCAQYAPTLPADVPAPKAWVLANVMQARALYRAQITGGGDQVGMDGVAVTVFPMDWQVQRLLRPKRGKPRLR